MTSGALDAVGGCGAVDKSPHASMRVSRPWTIRESLLTMCIPRTPLIGITCHAFNTPSPRSAVGQPYIDAVVAAGGAPICIPLGLDATSFEVVYRSLDGILLPGGDDVAPERYGQERHPRLGLVDDDRDDLELTLAARALRDDLPLLGICRGIQVLAVAAGGTLYQDLPAQLGMSGIHGGRGMARDALTHEIEIAPGSMLAETVGGGTAGVNSFHHQAVCAVPAGFTVSARGADGVIEGIESPGHRFVVGVQCHPEGIWKTTGPRFAGLFRAFVLAASHAGVEDGLATG